MISVTVAAHGRTKRVVGGNLRAYGSGRLSICDLDRENVVETDIKNWKIVRFVAKILEILTAFLRFCLPFLFSSTQFRPHRVPKRLLQSFNQPSAINKLDDDTLLQIISFLDAKTVVRCERVCHRWNTIVNDNLGIFPKLQTDQIRVLFDEGEVVIYPLDEKRFPTRYPHALPPSSRRPSPTSHNSIALRARPDPRRIRSSPPPSQLSLPPAPTNLLYLEQILTRQHISARGECSPSHLLTDRLLEPISHNLTSLRLWNNGKGSHYAISDETILALARGIINGTAVETIDLATCVISNEAVVTLIDAWVKQPPTDLSISFNNCGPVEKSAVLRQLAEYGILFEDEQRIRVNGLTLTLFC
ncbi:unnamed protein product [Caenorhabditis angaria]|uniref:F-box domain-containing protein n=1 Tax=Caenorhabditis angaria TaxID=860376 RepID=A0A9P1N9Z6_9PELO|nr:unnamed protein product [Caenorhabditis angaria]